MNNNTNNTNSNSNDADDAAAPLWNSPRVGELRMRLMAQAMTSPLPFSSHYIPAFIDGDDDALYQVVQHESMHHYLYRGQRMVRAPKNEFYYPENEDKTYKWGQQKLMYPGGKEYTGKVMPPLMVDMADLSSLSELKGKMVLVPADQ